MMPEIKKYSLVETLREKDRVYDHKSSVVGKSSMTFPDYCNSTRTQMFCSHLNQFLNILHPQFPYIFTGAENVVGENSSGYKRVKHRTEVIAKIEKYPDIVEAPTKYYLILYDLKKKQYDVVERMPAPHLTEDFSFQYDNSFIDSVQVGDILEPGDVLFKSASYDENLNYCYGRNATVAYVLNPWTAEDAAKISKSFSYWMTTLKEKKITIGLNMNEILLNMRGDKRHIKVLPDIGETCDSILAAVRAIRNEQIYYDLTNENLITIKDDDRVYFTGGDNTVITDYDIFCNNEELEKNSLTEQILRYSESQDKFYAEIHDICKDIRKSKKNYTKRIDYLNKRAKEYLNKKKKWRNKSESCFGNIEIDVTITREEPLRKGGKFTARMGNKSVVSKVEEDENMMYTETGKRVDVELNLLAITNRTTGFVPHELYATFVLNRTRERMETLKTNEEKEDLLFDVLGTLNRAQAEEYHADYRKMTEEEQDDYLQSCIDDGIFLNQIPIWEDEPIFFRLYNAHKKYDWLKPYKMYKKKWGQGFEVLTPMYVGEMYFIRLKQTGERGFSARNNGAVNMKGLPERSYKNRNNTSPISDTAVRLGESEFLAITSGTSTEEYMAFQALYRTSPKARKDIGKAAFSDDPIAVIDDKYRSTTAELFGVIFKSLSMEIVFENERDKYFSLDDETVRQRLYDGKTYFVTDKQFYRIKIEQDIRRAILEADPLLTTAELQRRMDEEMKKVDCIMKID